jgi:stage V sporulation protein D (sporulation-specific penicillin-binding protein)
MNRIGLNNEPKTKNSYNLRIFLLLLALGFAVLMITFRLFTLQIAKGGYYKAIAAEQHGTDTTISARRGDIYLSSFSGGPLLVATTVAKNMVYAVPKEITDKEGTAAKLADYLDMSRKDIEQRISGGSSFASLKKDLTDSEAKQIKTLKLEGIYFQAQDTRLYPEKNLASQVVGFLGFKDDKRVGQYGIEGKFETELAGVEGSLGAETDAAGRVINVSSRNFVPARNGDDIYLTIDPAIQFKVQEVLADSVTKHGAESGSVIVMNPKTGSIMAMANFPDFDPNNYGKVKDLSVFSNTTVSGAYEPGSVFKAITMAAAINEGKITPDTTYEDLGVVTVDDKQIKNSDGKAHGIQNMIQVLGESLNTGLVFVEQQIGNEKFRDYVKRFGFGKTTSIEIGGQPGNLDNLNKRGDVFFATASFGQGITVTPIQLLQSYTAFANGGKMVEPHIIDRIVHADGSESRPQRNKPADVIDSKTASTISAMLVEVVENGHGKQAGVKGYYVAGKTGTAQVASASHAGYDANKTIGSFIGFGPVENPEFLMIVRIDNPRDVKFAESTAAPAFGEIAQYILNYLKVPPSR